MKKNKLKAGVLVLFLLGINSAFADREVGNGGVAVVCHQLDGSDTMMLLDLYEGALSDLTFQRKSDPVEQQILDSMYKLSGLPKIKERVQYELTWINSHKGPLNLDKKFIGSGDYSKVDELPKNCEYAQLAVYKGDILTIDEPLLAKLPNTDQAAFFMHEALYAAARDVAHAKNSDAVRPAIATLFSEAQETSDIERAIKISVGDEITLPNTKIIFLTDMLPKNKKFLFLETTHVREKTLQSLKVTLTTPDRLGQFTWFRLNLRDVEGLHDGEGLHGPGMFSNDKGSPLEFRNGQPLSMPVSSDYYQASLGNVFYWEPDKNGEYYYSYYIKASSGHFTLDISSDDTVFVHKEVHYRPYRMTNGDVNDWYLIDIL